MVRKPAKRVTNTEKLETLRKELAASTSKLDEIERRLDELAKLVTSERSRSSQMIAELNVRLSSVAANVFEVSAVAAKALEMVDRSETKPGLWPDRQVELKK
jgi:predicted transcriptional regulator